MTHDQFDRISKEARLYADEQVGEYMVKIGKFDFRDFTAEEADKFGDIYVTAFNDHKSAALGEDAPF